MKVFCPVCQQTTEQELLEYDFWKCSLCGTAIRQEKDMPKPDQQEVYDTQWVKERRLFSKRYYYEARVRLNPLMLHFQIKSNKKILDVGCGTGEFVEEANKLGLDAHGLDLSKKAIKYARKKSDARYFLGAFETVNLPHKYHAICMNHLIEHIRRPYEFLGQIYENFEEKGILFISTPNLKAWDKKGIIRSELGGLSGTDHRILYTPESIKKILLETGFEILDVTTCTRYFVPFLILRNKIFDISTKIMKKITNKNLLASHKSKVPIKHTNRARDALSKLANLSTQIIFSTNIIWRLLWYPYQKISERNEKGSEIRIVARKNSIREEK